MKVYHNILDGLNEVKNKGICFVIRSPDNTKQLGKLYLTKTRLIWCRGKTQRSNGVELRWNEVMELLSSDEDKQAAMRAIAR